MKHVIADVEEIELEGDYRTVDGLRISCPQCGAEVEVYGRGPESARRGAADLQDQCTCPGKKFFDLGEWDD